MMIGNDYGSEVFTGRYDAFTGLVMLGDGKGSFNIIPSAKSGFYVGGDAKALASLNGGQLLVATQNIDSLKVFANKALDKENGKVFKPQLMDSWAEFVFTTGEKQRVEFFYGEGYLSQSSRSVIVPKGVKEIKVHDSKGRSRSVVKEEI
jgi:hypothetical protein